MIIIHKRKIIKKNLHSVKKDVIINLIVLLGYLHRPYIILLRSF